jgi:hypothetical protein
MSEKVFKHLKVKHRCKICKKTVTNNIIIAAPTNFSITDITLGFLDSEANLKSCKNCKGNHFKIKYTFYHEEKITAND